MSTLLGRRGGSGGKRRNSGSANEYARREALVNRSSSTYWISGPPNWATDVGLLNDPTRPLTVQSEGDLTVSTAGAVIQDLEVRGRIIVNANDVTIDNCWVRGPSSRPAGSDIGLIHVTSNTRNLLVRDSFLDPRAPGTSMDAIRHTGYTAERVYGRRTTDGFAAINTGGGSAAVVLLGSWMGAMSKFYPDTDAPSPHTDGTHNDAVQIQGTNGAGSVTIRGCRLDGYIDPATGNTGGLNTTTGGTPFSPDCTQTNASIQLNETGARISGLLIENNWINGGRIGVNGTDLANCTNIGSIINNRFDHGQYLDVGAATNNTQTIRIHPTPTAVLTGNVYDDNSVAVNVRRAT